MASKMSPCRGQNAPEATKTCLSFPHLDATPKTAHYLSVLFRFNANPDNQHRRVARYLPQSESAKHTASASRHAAPVAASSVDVLVTTTCDW